MKLIIATTFAALLAAPMMTTAGVQSLRGDNPLDAAEAPPADVKVVEQQGGFARSYDKQPPLIPHTIDKDELNVKVNTCLSKCHAEGKNKAPKPLESHYLDRDGKKTEQVSSRRWNCTQCHATMTDAKPLVENDFKGHLTKK